MTASVLDVLTVAAFAAAIFINRQAIVPLLAHLLWELMFLLPLNDFWTNVCGTVIYATAATVFIRIKPELRYAVRCDLPGDTDGYPQNRPAEAPAVHEGSAGPVE
jgi:hypothetical protein